MSVHGVASERLTFFASIKQKLRLVAILQFTHRVSIWKISVADGYIAAISNNSPKYNGFQVELHGECNYRRPDMGMHPLAGDL